jgi:hypothetical protein
MTAIIKQREPGLYFENGSKVLLFKTTVMKNIWLLLLLTVLLTCKAVTAQQRRTHQNLPTPLSANTSLTPAAVYGPFTDTAFNKIYYLNKSKNQKTAGWVMLGGGVVIGVVGAILFSENFEIFSDKNDASANTGGALFFIGAGSILGSIPFFISSAHNARKAASLSIGTHEILRPVRNSFIANTQPAITFRIVF